VISGMVAGFQAQNPDVRIDQSYGYAPDLADRLLNGTLDLAICPLSPGTLAEGLMFDTILPGRNVIACRAGHPLMLKKGLKPADLLRYSWIAPPTGSPLYTDLTRVLASLGTEGVRIGFTGGSLSAVLGVLPASDSLTVLPYSVVFTLRRPFGLGALSIRIDHPDRDLGLMYRPESSLNPAPRRLRTHILAQFEMLAATILHQEKLSLWRR
jgi:DNA-binding transcriptional LysR family regulator